MTKPLPVTGKCQHSKHSGGQMYTFAQISLCLVIFLCTQNLFGRTMAVDRDLGDYVYSDGSEEFNAPRDPGSYYPSDSYVYVPYEEKTFWSQLVLPDRKGVLKQMQFQMGLWQEDDDFLEYWDLYDTGQYQRVGDGRYETVNYDEKKGFISRQGLRYLDKRISGEIKQAEEGSTLYRVGQVRKALRPQTEVGFSEKYKLKFSAKVLRGLMIMRIKNPYIDDLVVEYKLLDSLAVWDGDSYSNETRIYMIHRFKPVGAWMNYEYKIHDEVFVWESGKSLTKKLNFVVSSVQTNDDLPYSGGANKILELRFNSPF